MPRKRACWILPPSANRLFKTSAKHMLVGDLVNHILKLKYLISQLSAPPRSFSTFYSALSHITVFASVNIFIIKISFANCDGLPRIRSGCLGNSFSRKNLIYLRNKFNEARKERDRLLLFFFCRAKLANASFTITERAVS